MFTNSHDQGASGSYSAQQSSRRRTSQSPAGSHSKPFYPPRNSKMQPGSESYGAPAGRGRSPPSRNYHHSSGSSMEGRGRSRSPHRAFSSRDQSPPFYGSYRAAQPRGDRSDFSPQKMEQRAPRSPQRYARYSEIPEAPYQRQYGSAPSMEYRRQPGRSPSPGRNYPPGPPPVGHYDRASYSRPTHYRDVGRRDYPYRRSVSPPMHRDYGGSHRVPYVNPYEFRRPQSPYQPHPPARTTPGGYREPIGFDDSFRNSRTYSGSRASGSFQGARKSPGIVDRGSEADRMESKTLFVGNIPYVFSEADLRDLFEKLGKLANVTIPVDRHTGRNKGFAFVEFEDRRDAEDAFQKYQGFQLQDRSLKIDWDIGMAKKSHLKPHAGAFKDKNADERTVESNESISLNGSNEEQALGISSEPSPSTSLDPSEPGWGN